MEKNLTNYFAFREEMERRRLMVEDFSEVRVDHTTPGFDKGRLFAVKALRAVPDIIEIEPVENHPDAA